jgi:hypothetical protein
MNHQKYTHVIRTATAVFAGIPDDRAPTGTSGHQRTSTDGQV